MNKEAFLDGELVVNFENGEQYTEEFEDAGRNMSLDLSDMDMALKMQIESIEMRNTEVKIKRA